MDSVLRCVGRSKPHLILHQGFVVQTILDGVQADPSRGPELARKALKKHRKDLSLPLVGVLERYSRGDCTYELLYQYRTTAGLVASRIEKEVEVAMLDPALIKNFVCEKLLSKPIDILRTLVWLTEVKTAMIEKDKDNGFIEYLTIALVSVSSAYLGKKYAPDRKINNFEKLELYGSNLLSPDVVLATPAIMRDLQIIFPDSPFLKKYLHSHRDLILMNLEEAATPVGGLINGIIGGCLGTNASQSATAPPPYSVKSSENYHAYPTLN